MKILVIDCTLDQDSWGSKDLVKSIEKSAQGAEIFVRRAPDRDLPRDIRKYTHWILSGSRTRADESLPWIDELIEKTKLAVEVGSPVLGVCFGHQLIARAFGGAGLVGPSSTPELGWVSIQQVKFNPIFKGVPETFISAVRHFDEIYKLPKNFEATAQSDRCGIQAFKMIEKPVFGIQFHPERSWDQMQKYQSHEFYFGKNLKKDVYMPELADAIFSNFLKIQ